MSSKIITVKRRKNTTNLPDHVYQESKRKIGSSFTKNGDIHTGLTFGEQKEYLPYILGVQSTDPAFAKEVKLYFRNLAIDVPQGGLKLEAGVDDGQQPINVADFIKYKFIATHPDVAADELSVKKNRMYKYFIYDQQAGKIKDVAALASRKKAYKEFIKLTGDDKKMNMVIRLYFENPKNMSTEDKELYLEKMLEENPQAFYSYVTSKTLETQSFIEECLSADILRKVGNAILLGDEKLGDSMEEAILFLKDKKNSSTVTTLKARLQAFD